MSQPKLLSEKRTEEGLLSSCYVIDPSRYEKDLFEIGGLTLFAVLWVLFSVFFFLLFQQESWLFQLGILIVACWVLLGISLTILWRNKKKSITIQNEMIVLSGMEFPWSLVEMPKQNVERLTLERYNEESSYSLNLFIRKEESSLYPGEKRILLAGLVAPHGQAKIFAEIAVFLRGHQITFIEKNDLLEKEKERTNNL